MLLIPIFAYLKRVFKIGNGVKTKRECKGIINQSKSLTIRQIDRFIINYNQRNQIIYTISSFLKRKKLTSRIN